MKSPAQFTDVQHVLDSAVRLGKNMRYDLGTTGQAVRWRQRAYMFRKATLDLDAKRKAGSTLPPATPYDGLILRLYDHDPTAVHIEFLVAKGELTVTETGELISVKVTPPLAEASDVTEDPYLDVADDLLKQFGR